MSGPEAPSGPTPPDRAPAPARDGVPGDAIAPAAGRRRALGRDPLAEPEALAPALDAVLRRAGANEAGPGGSGTRADRGDAPRPPGAPPRLADLGPPPDPATASFGLQGLDERRLRAVERLVPEGRAEDDFGLSPQTVRSALPPLLWLYRNWFRVESTGHGCLPDQGAVILAANHGGLLPFDGAMTLVDLLVRCDPPRLARSLVDRFVDRLPPLARLYARLGQVVGTRERFQELLAQRQAVLVFPEGVDGIRKSIAHRYRLQGFHTGFAEEAIRSGVPIVPVAIVGAEDQAPILYDVRPLARWLGLPAAPVTPTFPWLGPLGLLPLPVRYRIRYLDPIDPGAAGSGPGAAEELAREVRRRIQQALDQRPR